MTSCTVPQNAAGSRGPGDSGGVLTRGRELEYLSRAPGTTKSESKNVRENVERVVSSCLGAALQQGQSGGGCLTGPEHVQKHTGCWEDAGCLL